MPLIVTPDRELIFYGPFNTPSVACVELLNNSEDRLAYKFRTNITGRYTVKPNNGFISPYGKATVQSKNHVRQAIQHCYFNRIRYGFQSR